MESDAPFISRVRLRNYKSIAECDVRLGPLTILVGPNGSGKSNFLDALAFLARALETTPYQAVDERGGLAELVRRVPRLSDSFSMLVDVSVTGAPGEEFAAGTYGFEIGFSGRSDRGPRHFEVVTETCEVRAGGEKRRFVVREGEVHDRNLIRSPSRIEPDRLYLPIAGIDKTFGTLFSRLSAMRFYNFGLDELRRPQPQASGTDLGHRGEHLADVLGALEESHPAVKDRLNAYLRAVVPQAAGIDRWHAGEFTGRYVTVMLRALTGAGGREVVFGPDSMSDGTLRAAAVLAALFQPAVLEGRVPLLGIEEPEVALHPAAAGALFDALTEASGHVQVVATTQSPDLLDRDDLDVSTVRAVSMEEGLTLIGEVDEASRRIAGDKLYTLGELMRGNQLSPEPRVGGHAAELEV